jgi:hypothetical protein
LLFMQKKIGILIALLPMIVAFFWIILFSRAFFS